MQTINYQVLDQNKVDSLPNTVDINYGLADPEVELAKSKEKIIGLDLSVLPLEVYIPNIDLVPNKAYAMLRRNGFGASDSSILTGVNPFKTLDELIIEKASETLSAEEKEVGSKVAVRKGNDLEPLIMMKYERYFGTPTIKPKDMYNFKDYPQMKINFDGVTTTEKGGYFPVEIKVATMWGQKHYNPTKTIFSEVTAYGMPQGFSPLPMDYSSKNWSIESKAAAYGIPPYYYTQLQVEMLACNAEYGHLAVLFDKDWTLNVYHIWRDEAVQNAVILQSFKAWERVLALREARGWIDPSGETLKQTYMNMKEEEPTPSKNLTENIKEETKLDEY